MNTPAMGIVATLGVASLLAGCTAGGVYSRAEVEAGTMVELHERLQLPAGAARVHVQDGAVVREGDVDRFRVSCSFGLERQGGEPLAAAIEPDAFEVVGPSRSWAVAGGPWPSDGVQVAAVGTGTGLIQQQERASVQRLFYYTEIALRSERQPQVDDLRCMYDGAVVTDHYPTLGEIQAALGELASVRPPGG